MSMAIKGENYSVEWDEEGCEWVGFVKMYTVNGEQVRYPTVRVMSDFDIEKVMMWVLNYLDDMVNHHHDREKDNAPTT